MTLMDGHNIMFRLGLSADPHGALRVAQAVRSAAVGRKGIHHLVFDGPPSGGFVSDANLGNVRVSFSGSNKADDVILGMLRRRPSPKLASVVTADSGLASACRKIGASVVSCDSFFRREPPGRASPKSAPSEKPDHVDVREWENYFAKRGGEGD